MYAIIDADSIAFAIASTMARQEREDPSYINGADDFRWSLSVFITQIVEATDADGYELHLTGSESFRKIVAPSYKANRKGMAKPENLNAIKQQMVDEWGAFYAPEGFEADDSVAQEVFRCIALGEEYVICSIDKDMDTLPGWRYRWPTHNKAEALYFVTDYQARYNFWTQVLVGDSADGIKGIPWVGPKTAFTLLQGCRTENDFYKATLVAYKERMTTEENGMTEQEAEEYFNVNRELLRLGLEDRENVSIASGADEGD